MAYAATMSGMAFANAFLGICQAMTNALAAFHHLSYGIANALLIDEVIRFNASSSDAQTNISSRDDTPDTSERYAEVARYLGFGGKSAVDSLINNIDALKDSIGIRPLIKDYVKDEEAFLESLDGMAEQAFCDQYTGMNPRYPMRSELKQIFINAYYGKNSKQYKAV